MASDLAAYKPEADGWHDMLHHTSWFMILDNIITIALTLISHIVFFLSSAVMPDTPIWDYTNAIDWIVIILALL
ncbi:hypothetical protein LTR95_019272 [Oleoguttula sp. CCFEE 5521]